MYRLKKYFQNNKKETLILVVILTIASLLRFYRLSEYMTFLGDEGRDLLIIKKLLTDFDIPFIGPPSSVGNMYFGPFYYYLITPVLALFWLNPVAPAALVAFLSVCSVALIFYLSNKWFGLYPAITSAFLYALSPVLITQARSSWNPNPVPFFVLLCILGFYLMHTQKKAIWLLLVGLSAAAVMQLHYITTLFLISLIFIWIYEYVLIKQKRLLIKGFMKYTFFALVVFLVMFIPLIAFDLNNNYLNLRALQTFLSQKNVIPDSDQVFFLSKLIKVYQEYFISRYVTSFNIGFSIIFSFALLIPLLWAKKIIKKWPVIILYIWFLVGVLGLTMYKGPIYDHYLLFLAPAAFMLLGLLVSLTKKWQILTLILIVTPLAYLSIINSPIKYPPNRQLQRTQKVAEFMIDKSGGKPFNFALIAERNYDSAYRFFLEKLDAKPQLLPFKKTDQLLVVCEDPVCQPVGHPKYEIAAFGWTKIESENIVEGVRVFKLVHNEEAD